MPQEPAKFVVQFLESIGRRSDAELYLKLFRELPKHKFAVLAPQSAWLQDAPLPLLEPLRFLAGLGLYPVVAFNGLGNDAPSVDGSIPALAGYLADFGVECVEVEWRPGKNTETLMQNAQAAKVSLVDLAKASPSRTSALGALVSELGSRKLVVLRNRGGIGPSGAGRLRLPSGRTLDTHSGGVSLLNLRADYKELRNSELLDQEERALLSELRNVHTSAPSLLTSITSPLNLLRELFTVRGAGTLVKTGTDILSFERYEQTSIRKLKHLLEQTFDRTLASDFFQRAPQRIYLESEYRGAAILAPGVAPGVGYLTKFAVSRAAQGEGIGRDLWDTLETDQASVYWRARRDNPVADWYAKQCDGMHAAGAWWVYWRNLKAEDIPALVTDALQRPRDLVLPTEIAGDKEQESKTP